MASFSTLCNYMIKIILEGIFYVSATTNQNRRAQFLNLSKLFKSTLTLNLLNLLTSFFGTVHYQFWKCHDENLKLVIQQYRAWSDCTDVHVQAGLALYWWQSLITFSSSWIRVNMFTQWCSIYLKMTVIFEIFKAFVLKLFSWACRISG